MLPVITVAWGLGRKWGRGVVRKADSPLSSATFVVLCGVSGSRAHVQFRAPHADGRVVLSKNASLNPN